MGHVGQSHYIMLGRNLAAPALKQISFAQWLPESLPSTGESVQGVSWQCPSQASRFRGQNVSQGCDLAGHWRERFYSLATGESVSRVPCCRANISPTDPHPTYTQHSSKTGDRSTQPQHGLKIVQRDQCRPAPTCPAPIPWPAGVSSLNPAAPSLKQI